MTNNNLTYKQQSGQLRLKLLEMYFKANAGHIGCSLSCIDLMVATLIAHRQASEVFLLSKGHAAAALYACLNHIGEVSDEVLDTFYKNGTVLPAHPAPNKVQSIPFATGSLGHGLPIGAGIAHANKLLQSNDITYVLMSDGETNEGTSWEAGHYAVSKQLDNLIVLIDRNGLQGFDNTDKVLGISADIHKWQAIGFEVLETDGHDIDKLVAIIKELKTRKNGMPKMIIADTIKGRGVSYMENKLEWHYLPMKPEQFKQAVEEVKGGYGL
jgi:transketolase